MYTGQQLHKECITHFFNLKHETYLTAQVLDISERTITITVGLSIVPAHLAYDINFSLHTVNVKNSADKTEDAMSRDAKERVLKEYSKLKIDSPFKDFAVLLDSLDFNLVEVYNGWEFYGEGTKAELKLSDDMCKICLPHDYFFNALSDVHVVTDLAENFDLIKKILKLNPDEADQFEITHPLYKLVHLGKYYIIQEYMYMDVDKVSLDLRVYYDYHIYSCSDGMAIKHNTVLFDKILAKFRVLSQCS